MALDRLSSTDYDKLITANKDIMINNVVYIYLGKGGQGTVYRNKNTGNVIKVFRDKINNSIINELVYLKMCKYAIDKEYTPNLIEYHDEVYIDDRIVISMEMMDGTLEDWARNKQIDLDWSSMLFQLLHVTYVMNNVLFIKHNDMKPKNILYKRLPQQKIYRYIFGNKVFDVPINYLFKVIDFGHSKYDKKKIVKDKPHDLSQIFILHKRSVVDAMIYKHNISELKSMASNHKEFNEYYQKNILDISKTFKKYPQKIKDKMERKMVSYFLVENNLVKISDYVDNTPGDDIMNAMSEFIKLNFTELFSHKFFNIFNTRKEGSADAIFNIPPQ